MDDPYSEIRKLIGEWDANHATINGEHAIRNPYLSWLQLRDMEFTYDWLVNEWWPENTHLHLFATGKTGKSLLMLWVAANIALGRDPFTWEPIKRQRVSYIDNEMTLKDLHDRIVDMGFEFEELEDWLLYHPYPILAPMDTATGGIETLEMMRDDRSFVLVIDTLSRVVRGEENNNDTYRNFYNHTGRLLKAANMSMARLDHAGHDPHKSRGASAKVDDVDLVYALERRADTEEIPGFKLTRTHSRIGNTREFIDLKLTEEPTAIRMFGGHLWTKNAIDKAKELDSISAPLNVSNRDAVRMLKAGGFVVGKTATLAEAIRLRQNRGFNL